MQKVWINDTCWYAVVILTSNQIIYFNSEQVYLNLKSTFNTIRAKNILSKQKFISNIQSHCNYNKWALILRINLATTKIEISVDICKNKTLQSVVGSFFARNGRQKKPLQMHSGGAENIKSGLVIIHIEGMVFHWHTNKMRLNVSRRRATRLSPVKICLFHLWS